MSTPTLDAETGAIVLQTPTDLAPATAQSISEGFASLYLEADKWRAQATSIVVSDVSDRASMRAAREARLALRDIRVSADKKRKAMKADVLLYGRAIDGAYNMLEHAIAPLERYLAEQEEFAERKEAERKEALKAHRIKRLLDADEKYSPIMDVVALTDEQFDGLIEDVKGLRSLREAREAQSEAARIEAEIAAKAEKERVERESERLREEAAKREAEIKAEREAAAKAQREAAEKARKELEIIEAKARAEREAAEKLAREEAAKREAAEAESRRLKEAEAARIAAEKQRQEDEAKAIELAAKKAASAPNRKKLALFAEQVRQLEVPTLTNSEGEAIAADIAAKVLSFAKWIEDKAKLL